MVMKVSIYWKLPVFQPFAGPFLCVMHCIAHLSYTAGAIVILFTDEEAEVQRGEVTLLRLQGWSSLIYPGSKPPMLLEAKETEKQELSNMKLVPSRKVWGPSFLGGRNYPLQGRLENKNAVLPNQKGQNCIFLQQKKPERSQLNLSHLSSAFLFDVFLLCFIILLSFPISFFLHGFSPPLPLQSAGLSSFLSWDGTSYTEPLPRGPGSFPLPSLTPLLSPWLFCSLPRTRILIWASTASSSVHPSSASLIAYPRPFFLLLQGPRLFIPIIGSSF